MRGLSRGRGGEDGSLGMGGWISGVGVGLAGTGEGHWGALWREKGGVAQRLGWGSW